MSGDIPTRCPAEFFRLFVMMKGIWLRQTMHLRAFNKYSGCLELLWHICLLSECPPFGQEWPRTSLLHVRGRTNKTSCRLFVIVKGVWSRQPRHIRLIMKYKGCLELLWHICLFSKGPTRRAEDILTTRPGTYQQDVLQTSCHCERGMIEAAKAYTANYEV